MNRQLKRIAQTLNRLEQGSAERTTATVTLKQPVAPEIAPPAPTPAISFDLERPGNCADPGNTLVEPPTVKPHTQPVQPFSAADDLTIPTGDKFKLPTFSGNQGFSRHQNGSNPDLSLNLLQESMNILQSWRTELQEIVTTVQEIYREGPIVDGWLECSTQKVEATTEVLRNAEVAQLMGYVESICEDPSSAQPEYRLCGLSADGRIWSIPCPQSQLASTSLAISRHQKLQPLLQRKLILEKQLSQAAELTAKLHSTVQSLA